MTCYILSVAVCSVLMIVVHAERITFWADVDNQGESVHIEMEHGQCIGIEMPSDELVSLNSYGKCVELYTRDDCMGGKFRLDHDSPCHRSLGDCDINDRVRSMRLCPPRHHCGPN